jgi:hypothetical protein
MFFPAADTIAFTEGGTESMRIDSSGRVLIGSTSASGSNLLQVTGDASISGLTVGKGGGAVSTNTAVGFQSLNATNTGGFTTAFGYQAGINNTSGQNTLIGANSGQYITTGTRNTGVGTSTLGFNNGAVFITSNDNSAYGSGALTALTSGSSNTALGSGSLGSNTTASQNTAVGYQSLYSNTTATENVAVGFESLRQNTTGASNTAVGHQANYSNTTGGLNIAMGRAALYSNTTGANNTALGYYALLSNTTASRNTAVGYQAGYSNTTSQYNVHIGHKAGYSQTTPSGGNTFIGDSVGYSATTGEGNIVIGTINSNGNNPAGYGLTTGSRNTFVGHTAGNEVTTGAKNTVIGGYGGNQGGLDIRTASNYIVLSDGDGNPRQIIDGSGNVFIGTTAAPVLGDERLGVKSSNGCFGFQLTNTTNDTLGGMWTYAGTTAGSGTYVAFYVSSSGTQIGSITHTTTATAYNTSSDYRLKENIAPMTGALAKVQQLKPCTYTWKADGSSGEGFIAHELAEVCPNAVTGEKDAVDENGKIKPQAIDTSFLVATLTAAIQELKAEFDAYKATHP